MKNGLKVIILSLATLAASYLNAIIPEIEIWSNGKHYLYLLKDLHLDNTDAKTTIKQHQDIIWLLQQSASDICLIVEDFATEGLPENILLSNELKRNDAINHPYRTLWNTIINKLRGKKDPTTPGALFDSQLLTLQKSPLTTPTNKQLLYCSPLCYLAYFCQSVGIRNYNTECMVKIFRYLYAKDLNPQEESIAKQSIIKLLSNRLQEMSYNPLVKNLYDTIQTNIETLKTLATQDQKEAFVLGAVTTRSALLESLTINKILASGYIKHIVIYEGAFHIERIKPVLSELGYAVIKTAGLPTTALLKEAMLEPITIKDLICPTIPAKYIDPIEACINNPVDIRKTFTQIFKEQKLNSK